MSAGSGATGTGTAATGTAGATGAAGITARTRVFAVLGDPIAHSQSPVFQNAAMRHFGMDAVYVALRCAQGTVGPLIHALCQAGGGGNVTAPYKATAAACLERPSPLVERTGACNTFWSEGGVVCGDNTDVEGFRFTAARLLPHLHGCRVLILGAGGAASAALCALLDAGAAHITLLNRSAERAAELALRLDPDLRSTEVAASADSVDGQDFDLVINATSLGMSSADPLPLDLSRPGRVGAAIDIICGPGGETAWVRHAHGVGIAAADGTDMLLAQGAAAFSRWFGVDPPLAEMRAALARP
jgi:shikimate dehydrogenase